MSDHSAQTKSNPPPTWEQLVHRDRWRRRLLASATSTPAGTSLLLLFLLVCLLLRVASVPVLTILTLCIRGRHCTAAVGCVVPCRVTAALGLGRACCTLALACFFLQLRFAEVCLCLAFTARYTRERVRGLTEEAAAWVCREMAVVVEGETTCETEREQHP
jgi:hypothetical protein